MLMRGASPMLRGVALFWAVALAGGGVGAGVLQWLGPPQGAPPIPGPAKSVTAPDAPKSAAVATPAPVLTSTPAVAPAPVAAPKPEPPRPRAPGAAIPAPDKELMAPSAAYPGLFMPRIGPDGRTPMRVYAAGAEPQDARPRVALLLSGVGPAEADSAEAIRVTPPGISLAISPYAVGAERLANAARASGHEYLLSIPMEPMGYPLNDAGNQALMSIVAAETNAQRLEWSLTRFAGYVGATGALGRLHGERFAQSGDPMQTMLDTLATRGLLYIDPRPRSATDLAQPAPTPGRRAVDLVIDDPPVRTEIDAKLAQLEKLARDRGTAIGLAGGPTPVTTERLVAWTNTLALRGVVLVPVSALTSDLSTAKVARP